MGFLKRGVSSVAWVALLLAGCVEKAGPEETGAESSSSGTTGGTQGETTVATSETGVTEAPDSDTEMGMATDTGTDTDTDTGTETDTDDTGMPLPAECLMVDPNVKAEFSLAIGEWPEMSDAAHDIDVMCTIDTMMVGPDTLEQALTCDDEGTPRALTLRTPLPTGGAVTWSEGDAVHLIASHFADDDFGLDKHVLRMFTADEQPLLVGHFGGSENGPDLGQITYSAEFPCGPEDFNVRGTITPFAVRFEFGAEAVTIVHGHRDVLPIEGTSEVFAIDLEEATTNHCCHYLKKYAVLIQRISPL